MSDWNVVGLFCEDIREEKTGVHTLVGVFPDNLNVSELPGMMPKLCIYVRFHLDVNADVRSITAMLRFPTSEQSLGGFDPDLIKKTQEDSRKKGTPLAGLILKGISGPIKIPGPGRILAIAKVNDDEIVCGSLNIQKAP